MTTHVLLLTGSVGSGKTAIASEICDALAELEDVGVEGDPVDDGGDEAGSGKTVPHSSGRLVPIAMEAFSSRSALRGSIWT